MTLAAKNCIFPKILSMWTFLRPPPSLAWTIVDIWLPPSPPLHVHVVIEWPPTWTRFWPNLTNHILGWAIRTSVFEDPQHQPQSLRFFEVEDWVLDKEQYRLAMGICTRRKSGICKGALEPTRTFYTLKFMILISLSKSVGSLKIHKGLIFHFKTS